MKILGIHRGVTLRQHDPGAALIVDGKLVAAIEEERLLRVKSQRGHLPIRAAAIFPAIYQSRDGYTLIPVGMFAALPAE